MSLKSFEITYVAVAIPRVLEEDATLLAIMASHLTNELC